MKIPITAVYACTLKSEINCVEAILNIQMIEIDRASNYYEVHQQYGKQGSKLTTTRSFHGSFNRALDHYRMLFSKKTSISEGHFVEASTLLLPEAVLLMLDEKAAELSALHDLSLNPIPPPDMDDPRLLSIIDDDNWVAIPSYGNDHLLEKKGKHVLLDDHILPKKHPFAIDATQIGGDFKLSGYIQGGDFFAFDIRDEEEYRDMTYVRRIKIMANLIAGAVIQHVKCAPFKIGAQKKREATEQVGTTYAKIRFLKLDVPFKSAEQYMYPSNEND